MAVDDEERNQKHDDGDVQGAGPPFVWMVSLEESTDAQDVEHDGDDADDHADRSTGARGDAKQGSDEREDHVSEQATDAGDENRLREDPFGLRLASLFLARVCSDRCIAHQDLPYRMNARF